MASLAELRVADPVSQDLVHGYTGLPELGYIAAQVMPIKTVPKRAATIPAFGREMKRRHDTVVVNKQAKPQIDFTLGHRDIATDDRYAAYPVTKIEEEELSVDAITPIEQFAYERALDEIFRDLEAEVAALVFAAGSWTNNQAAAAAWAAVAYALTTEIDTRCTTVENAIGVDRSILSLVLGANTWPWVRRNTSVRQEASIILGRRENVSAPLGLVNQDIVAAALGVKEVIVGKERIATDLTPPTFTPLWDDDAALMYIPSGTDIMVPAFGYLIRREGHPATMPPWQDKTKIGDPMVYEVGDCIRPNLIETTVGGGTSDSGYYWDNAV